ncbi:MAG: MGMT family protein [bacterium]|nr:MGMT family protein [bacterium]
MNKREIVYQITSEIPQGKVLTYSKLALLSGVTNPRLVGNYLHQNPDEEAIPCHRVVNMKGRLAPSFAFGGTGVQKARLEREGVEVVGDKVDLEQYLWRVV